MTAPPPGPAEAEAEAGSGTGTGTGAAGDGTRSRLTVVLTALGTVIGCYGAYRLLTGGVPPLAWGRFALGVAVLHDVVLAPAALAVGVLVARAVPPRARALVSAGLVISGATILATLPTVLHPGRTADVPSALPLDYGRGLAVVLGAVWAGVGLVALAGVLTGRQRRPEVRAPARRASPSAPPRPVDAQRAGRGRRRPGPPRARR